MLIVRVIFVISLNSAKIYLLLEYLLISVSNYIYYYYYYYYCACIYLSIRFFYEIDFAAELVVLYLEGQTKLGIIYLLLFIVLS